MNFHKKIGFLAALLLTFGLGVPDGFAQTITLTTASTEIFEGGGDQTLQVTVTLSADVSADTQVTVTSSKYGPSSDLVITVNNGDDSANATLTLTVPEETTKDKADETITLTGAASGYTSGTVNVTIIDNDIITALGFAPVFLTEGVESTLDVTVTLSGNTSAPITVTLDALLNGVTFNTATVEIDSGEDSDVASFSPITIPEVAGHATRNVVVEATAPGYYTHMKNLLVRDAKTLSLTLGTTTISESDQGANVAPTVTLNAQASETVTVVLTPDKYGDPVTTTISAGSLSTANNLRLELTPIPDADANNETVTVTAEAQGYPDDTAVVTVIDAQTGGAITLAVSPAELTEAAGGTVSVDVTLATSVTSNVEVNVEAKIDGLSVGAIVVTVVGTNQAPGITGSGSLDITSRADTDIMDKTVTLTATEVTRATATATVTLTDPDKGTITLKPNPTSIEEGVTTDVAVAVTVSHPPASVTITPSANGDPVVASVPASGTATVTLSLSPPEDGDADDGLIGLVATADRYEDGLAIVTITDDDAGQPKITITTSPTELRESANVRNVEVTATLPAAPGDGNTVVVALATVGSMPEASGAITVSGTDTSGKATLKLASGEDEVYKGGTITVTGSSDDYTPGSATISVIDNDTVNGTITVTAAPPSVTKSNTATDVTLTVKVVMAAPDTELPTLPFTVNLQTDKGTLASTVNITSIAKNKDKVPEDTKAEGKATVVLSLTPTQANTEGTITVTASADGYKSGTRTISVTDRSALDIAGYRAVIAKPTGTNWANVNNDQVIVDVIRVNSVAYPWSQFESIKVSVRDTAHDNTGSAPLELEQVTASEFNKEDNGNITFSEPGSPSRGDVIWRGNDTIRFELRVRANSVHTRPTDDVNKQADNGQYFGVYAHVEFKVGSLTEALTNMEDTKPVYPSNPTLIPEANRYRGDGRLVKIDNLKPSNAAIAAVSITNAKDGTALSQAPYNTLAGAQVKVGDEVRVAIKVNEDVLFRETKLRIQIQPQDGKGTYKERSYTGGQVAPFTKTKTFTSSDVINADSLRHTWKITEGFFEYKTDDYVDFIGPKGTKFQADNTTGRVLVAIGDQANNWSGSRVMTFAADSRSPKISILYPSAMPDTSLTRNFSDDEQMRLTNSPNLYR